MESCKVLIQMSIMPLSLKIFMSIRFNKIEVYEFCFISTLGKRDNNIVNVSYLKHIWRYTYDMHMTYINITFIYVLYKHIFECLDPCQNGGTVSTTNIVNQNEAYFGFNCTECVTSTGEFCERMIHFYAFIANRTIVCVNVLV